MSYYLLIFFFAYTVASLANEVPRNTPVPVVPGFSDAYTVKGTLYIPYAEIREPFVGWFDLSKGSSRVDYYGNMVKTYQLAKKGEFGTSLKVAPYTTEEVQNQNTCFQVDGSAGAPVVPQSVLPDLTGFQNVGQDMLNGIICDKWKLVDEQQDKVNSYTMWTTGKTVRTKSSVSTKAIPVRYEMKGFNTLFGSHYDHYYLDYEWFSDETPNEDVFIVETNLTCQGFPGPGENHLVTFNPMMEFINNYQQHNVKEFETFKEKHGKVYQNVTEHAQRLGHFTQNLRFINSHNRANKGYYLGVNHFADRSELEMKALRGNIYAPDVVNKEGQSGEEFPYTAEQIGKWVKDVPESVDWRLAGAVTPVKDQSVCGSCWSFGSTGSVEGAYFLKYGKQKVLSQQALIDCSWGYGNNGCDGGEDFRSYQWIIKRGGLPTADAYGSYLGQDAYCHVDASMDRVQISGWVNVTSGDQNALKLAVALHGPISVAIDASQKTFRFYSHGVYYEPNCGNTVDELDHAVLVVGYGKLDGKDYWLVKNSWSNYWGNIGYILMAQQDNNCGVATDATYVNVV